MRQLLQPTKVPFRVKKNKTLSRQAQLFLHVMLFHGIVMYLCTLYRPLYTENLYVKKQMLLSSENVSSLKSIKYL